MTCAETTLNRIEERLLSLERQNRRLRFAVCIGAGLVISLFLGGGGRAGDEVLEARGLLLRGPDGSLRGSFVISDDGGVRLTLIESGRRAKAGLWMDADGHCSAWGFDELRGATMPAADARSDGGGKLVAVGTDARIIERRHDKWICGYRLGLRNETGDPIDQPFYVELVDDDGYVLGRQARLIRLGAGESTTINGEIGLSPERAEQVAQVVLAAYDR